MQATKCPEKQQPGDMSASNPAPASTRDSAASFEDAQSPIPSRNKRTEEKILIPEQAPLYSQLDEELLDIRVLNLLPGSDGIVCNLDFFSCTEEFPEYTALSYCWGNTAETEAISVNGYLVSITKSLLGALQKLRKRQFGRLWIDALCINQSDEIEKGHQVRRMADIYRNATQTIAWLGQENHYPEEISNILATFSSDQLENRANEEMMEISSDNPYPPVSSWESTNLKALNSFLEIQYWERTWVIQELALSRQVIFVWGAQSWDHNTIDGINPVQVEINA